MSNAVFRVIFVFKMYELEEAIVFTLFTFGYMHFCFIVLIIVKHEY